MIVFSMELVKSKQLVKCVWVGVRVYLIDQNNGFERILIDNELYQVHILIGAEAVLDSIYKQ